MRKYSLVITLLVFTNVCLSQNPEIKAELPTIIPPSPTVSALMKFEEVPVSNYTGVPDIAIPLFSSPTLSKDINLDISLKYHSGVGANDRASDVGLGWSLFAGGTISRTVRGLPDEILSYPGGLNGTGKIGIYQNNVQQNSNNYYYFIQNIANETQDFYRTGTQLTTQETNIGNEFLWTAAFTGKYDTEHDLWQFNFMGFSGRFYIKKNTQTNQLEVQPLDDYRITIVNHYSQDPYLSANLFIPIGFTVYDEKGNRFIFDVVENTVNKFANSNTYYTRTSGGGFVYDTSTDIQADKSFKSSFHLSKVYDSNNNLLVEFVFKAQNYIESFTNSSISSTDLDKTAMASTNNCSDFPPLESMNNSTTIVSTKKIDFIDIKGFSKIYFDYSLGRQDTNINVRNQTAYLDSLIIKDSNENVIKEINFEYNYSITLFKRMILKKYKEFTNQTNPLSTEFTYKINPTFGKVVGKDYWGYLNLTDPCYSNLDFYRRVSTDYCDTDILQTIKYPTGGFTNFTFEPNTYSFKGDQAVINYFEDEQNMDFIANDNISIYGSNSYELLNTLNIDKIKFYPSINLYGYPDVENQNAWIEVKSNTSNEWSTVGTALACYNIGGDCCVDFYPEENRLYRIRYAYPNYNPNSTSSPGCSIPYEIYRKNYTKQYLAGGGNRIKKIEYFERSNSAVAKTKNYQYNFFNNQNKSSGSLAFSKPIFKYFDMFSVNNSFYPYGIQNFSCSENRQDYIYTMFTSGNNFVPVKTGGADVGYQNVTVKEVNNGETQYVYTSPITSPEENIPSGPPFIPTKNFDYKRGLLLSEIVFNSSNDTISEIKNKYDIIENIIHTGTRFRKPNGACYTGSKFSNYDQYANTLITQPDCVACISNYAMSTSFLCGLPLDFDTPKIMPYPIFEAYGWAKLTLKTTKNYFYEGNTERVLQTDETYTYNPINKKISEQTVTNSFGEVMKTKYFYLGTVDTPTSQNNISTIEKVETYRGSELLSTSKINYATNFAGNISYLPQTVATSKGSNALENRIRYNRYDQFGHTLEVQQENGMLISYIWGYNNTQPIAKIENAAYASITPSLITNAQTASNTGTEASLLTALTALRTALPSAMVTTMTYKPLIGVSTITDPKGDRMTYIYDEFNRLKEVRDKDNNILSENQYHYRTPN